MSRRSGFTLIELLTVMGIMALLMGISAIGFVGMRRGGEMRGAIMSVRTTVALARQQAVTKRQKVSVVFGPIASPEIAQNWIAVTMSGGGKDITNNIVYLPLGIYFSGFPSQNPLIFSPSGSASGTGSVTVKVKEKAGVGKSPQEKSLDIWLLTGLAEEQ